MNTQELAKQFVHDIEMAIRLAEPSVWLSGPNRERGSMFIAFPQNHAFCVALLEGKAATVGMSMRSAGMAGEQVAGSIEELADKTAKLMVV